MYGRSKKDVFGGGLITLVRRNLPFERIIGWKGKTTEGLKIRLVVSSTESWMLTNVYRPPIRHIQGVDEKAGSESCGMVEGRKIRGFGRRFKFA